jgi:1-acyl-sn-glycerol-3-phosphate acyltransferase
VLNHPSWWDPLVGLTLTQLFPDHQHFAPIDAKALVKYRFFERLGFFGIDPGSTSGGRVFLRTCETLLHQPNNAIWITAQGRFADPRQRPVALLPGVAHLARRLPAATILPLALEYPFWQERQPEALGRFGPSLIVDPATPRSVDEWQSLLDQAMTATQDGLAEEAIRRDPSAFEVLLSGQAGVGGVYDVWRRFKAWLSGRRFRPQHGDAEDDHP